jgi:hypothetical protein
MYTTIIVFYKYTYYIKRKHYIYFPLSYKTYIYIKYSLQKMPIENYNITDYTNIACCVKKLYFFFLKLERIKRQLCKNRSSTTCYRSLNRFLS